MADVEKEIAILHQFRDGWRSLGWWADIDYLQLGDLRDTDEYRATLISPKRFKFLLDQDYLDSTVEWEKRPSYNSYFGNPSSPPERRESPTAYQMYDEVWSVGETAVQACVGAILVARRKFSEEMPTRETFKLIQCASMSVRGES